MLQMSESLAHLTVTKLKAGPLGVLMEVLVFSPAGGLDTDKGLCDSGYSKGCTIIT